MSESVGFVLLARTIKIRHETMHVRHRAQTLVPVPVRDGRDASGRAGARESGPVERPDERRHATRPDVPTPPDAQPCPHTTRPRPSSPARVASTSLAPHTTYTTVVLLWRILWTQSSCPATSCLCVGRHCGWWLQTGRTVFFHTSAQTSQCVHVHAIRFTSARPRHEARYAYLHLDIPSHRWFLRGAWPSI